MKLEKLSQSQKASLKERKLSYVEKFLNNDKIDKKKAIEAITFVYSLIKKECPKIYKCVSPFAMQKKANELKGTKNKAYSTGTCLTLYWASVYAYYDTFVDFGIITQEKFPKYFQLRKFIESNIFMTIEFENAIVICEKPIFVKRNSTGMHSLEGPAIAWEDGYCQHYINGRVIPTKEFNAIKNKTYTIEDFFNEKNEEVKSVCLQMIIELYGDNYLSNFFSSILKEADTYVNKKDDKYLEGTTRGMNIGVYTLFKGSLNDYDIAYVRCYCPSTDRMFYLGVEPKFNKAKDASAHLYTIPSKLKPFIKAIRTQGQRFSTTFTPEGLKPLKTLSKAELDKLTTISGEEYFKKMQYEF